MGGVNNSILEDDRLEAKRQVDLYDGCFLRCFNRRKVHKVNGVRSITSLDALVIIDQCFGNDFGLCITYPIEINGMCGKEVF